MKNILLALVISGLIFTAQTSECAGPKEFDEYEVKAAFLGNFLKFIDRPGKDREPGNHRICIYGSDPFGQYTADIESMKIRGRSVQVRKLASLRALNECSILFISSSERRRINSVLEAVRDIDVLTVGDSEGYARQGVMINFYIEASKVKFEINLTSIKKSRINVSSQLLKLGRVVDHE